MPKLEQFDPADYLREIGGRSHDLDARCERADLDSVGRMVELEVAEPRSLQLSGLLFQLVSRFRRPK